MNREIKINFWCPDRNKMFYWVENFEEILIVNGKMIPKLNNSVDIDWDWYNATYIPLEYTGLKDIKNKDIYEGDIIEGGYFNILADEFISRKYIIEYDNGGFIGKITGHTPYGDTWLQFIKCGEVIGNIYENPDLLEE